MTLSITLILIGITTVISLIALSNRALLNRLMFEPPLIARKHEWDRFITHGFVHGSGLHLLFNMMTLYFFGVLVEQLIGRHIGAMGFLAFYLSAIVVSSIPSYFKHRNDPNYRSLGASGAVSAVLACFILVAPWNIIYVFFFPVPAIVLLVGYIGYVIWVRKQGGPVRIEHDAHLAGAAYGALFFILLDPRVVPHFFARLLSPSFG
jgi:membrane associated rhomboid family serine protease